MDAELVITALVLLATVGTLCIWALWLVTYIWENIRKG